MALDILLRRNGQSLVPFDAFSAEQMLQLSAVKPLNCKITQPRSIDQHRFYWKELSNVITATECAPSSKHLHQALKLALGYTMPVFDARGEIVSHVPDSTAFNAMPQHEFNTYFNSVQKLVAERWGYVMQPRKPSTIESAA